MVIARANTAIFQTQLRSRPKKPYIKDEKTMAGKTRGPAKRRAEGGEPRSRMRRSDDEKVALVRQVMASGNQSAEIKRLGIYPNQFYDWKKRYVSQLGGGGTAAVRSRGQTTLAARSVADEAKAFIQNKASLLDRLRQQRAELDELITQLEA
jgi:transposase-like protein